MDGNTQPSRRKTTRPIRDNNPRYPFSPARTLAVLIGQTFSRNKPRGTTAVSAVFQVRSHRTKLRVLVYIRRINIKYFTPRASQPKRRSGANTAQNSTYMLGFHCAFVVSIRPKAWLGHELENSSGSNTDMDLWISLILKIPYKKRLWFVYKRLC